MKILVVEDDYIYAESLKVILLQNLFMKPLDVIVVSNYEDAITFIKSSEIDLVISDLILEGDKTGIDVLEYTRSMNLPIILMTSSDDLNFYQRAKSVKTLNYLIKPIHPITFISTIEKVISEHKKEYLTMKDHNNKYIRMAFEEIKWIESERNYSTIVSLKRKIAIKISLTQLMEKLDSRFQRCHHSYIVNINFVTALNSDFVFLDEITIPVGRSFKKSLTELLK